MAEFLRGFLIFWGYLIPAAAIVFTIRKATKINDELFRKILHFILLGAYVPLLFGFSVWWHCVAFLLPFCLLLYPILKLAVKIPGFSRFVNERKKGEYASSALLAFVVMALSVTVGWGLMNDKFIVLAGVYSWGVGDAFAALIGKKYGKRKITWKIADNKKSVEGSLAMLVSSTVAVFIVLLVRGGINPFLALGISIVAAAVSTFVELCSMNGLDTILCPAVSMAVILPLIALIGG